MKNVKRMTGFILMCVIAIMMTGAAMASVNGTEQNGTNGNVTETGTAGTGNAAGTGTTGNVTETGTNGNTAVSETNRTGDGGEISSFNNYGANGKYAALGEYEVAYGSKLEDVTSKLPNTLTATLTTGEEVEVPVTWVCVNDNLGGTAYVPEHGDVSAVYTFEAKLGEGYALANNLPGDYVMPFTTVRYTENAQTLNSNAVESGVNEAVENVGGMSTWSWIIWIIVIVIVVVVLWWLFAGNRGNGRDGDNV